jgi:hypothetical protein
MIPFVFPSRGAHCCHSCFYTWVNSEKAKYEQSEQPIPIFCSPFIVCSICGNKRCPKATDHSLECTNCNDPGQPGSVYE